MKNMGQGRFHPGAIFRETMLDPRELTVTAAAKALGVDYSTLSRFVNGHSSLSLEMAVKLEKAFGGDAEHWLNIQAAYDRRQLVGLRQTVNVKRSYLHDEDDLEVA